MMQSLFSLYENVRGGNIIDILSDCLLYETKSNSIFLAFNREMLFVITY